MEQIKVLIIDDSNIVHVILEKVITAHDDIRIIGNAYDGKEGIEMAKNLSPDIIIMDISMPKMDGLEAIQEIMHEKPTPIIVFSSVSKDIVDLSFKAVELGAVEIVEKPFSEDFSLLKKNIENNLIRSIKTFADFKVIRRIKKSKLDFINIEPLNLKESKERLRNKRILSNKERFVKNDIRFEDFPIIAIAASTGGPQTIKKLLEGLAEKKINAGIVIIQHMAEGFMKGFSDWLSSSTHMDVNIAEEGDHIKSNSIYIAPGEYHLTFDEKGNFIYLDSPPIQGIRPSADIMYHSIAKAYKNRVIAIILTGMGNDGTQGLYKVKENCGYIISQDEESSMIFGMPKSAIESGVVDVVLNITEMPNFLEKLCRERTFVINERE